MFKLYFVYSALTLENTHLQILCEPFRGKFNDAYPEPWNEKLMSSQPNISIRVCVHIQLISSHKKVNRTCRTNMAQ